MNRLNKYTNRSIPLFWDNIDWFQQATRDAFKALMDAIGGQEDANFIISGCVVHYNSELSIDVTAGWVVVDGEICQVDAQSFTTQEGYPYFVYVINPTNDSTGTDQDSNGNTVQMHLVRKAIVAGSVTYVNKCLATGDRIYDVLKSYILADEVGWTAITGFLNGHVAGSPIPMFRIDAS